LNAQRCAALGSSSFSFHPTRSRQRAGRGGSLLVSQLMGDFAWASNRVASKRNTLLQDERPLRPHLRMRDRTASSFATE
jgi:hypothetical protein